MKKFFKILSITFSALMGFIFLFCTVMAFNLPDKYTVTSESSYKIRNLLSIKELKNIEFKTNYQKNNNNFDYYTNLLLFNIIPIKKVNIKKIKELNVVPGGEPFGIKLFTKGVIVVGISEIKTCNGLENPAKQAGIQKGDIILSINNTEISNNEDLMKFVEISNGNDLSTKIIRNGMNYETTLRAVKSESDGIYKLGIWVRDSSAGIGTITFWDKSTNLFAGLGHGICDIDTGEILPLAHGDIVKTNINGIFRGSKGNPGELKGYFIENELIGELTKNAYSGVYGTLKNHNFTGNPIAVAMKQQVKKGKSQILTTIFGTTPKYYDAEIVNINYNEENPSKNMVIKITDNALLSQTGGIIQGMSGSPIVQDGKLVGAVTHVFVNDPQKGYAIFIENMIDNLLNMSNLNSKKII